MTDHIRYWPYIQTLFRYKIIISLIWSHIWWSIRSLKLANRSACTAYYSFDSPIICQKYFCRPNPPLPHIIHVVRAVISGRPANADVLSACTCTRGACDCHVSAFTRPKAAPCPFSIQESGPVVPVQQWFGQCLGFLQIGRLVAEFHNWESRNLMLLSHKKWVFGATCNQWSI